MLKKIIFLVLIFFNTIFVAADDLLPLYLYKQDGIKIKVTRIVTIPLGGSRVSILMPSQWKGYKVELHNGDDKACTFDAQHSTVSELPLLLDRTRVADPKIIQLLTGTFLGTIALFGYCAYRFLNSPDDSNFLLYCGSFGLFLANAGLLADLAMYNRWIELLDEFYKNSLLTDAFQLREGQKVTKYYFKKATDTNPTIMQFCKENNEVVTFVVPV